MVQVPKDAGKRLMAHVIDDLALREPERTVCIMGKGLRVADGFFDFSASDLAHTVNYTSWWIDKTFGRSSDYETLTYIGANDIRYLVFVVACNKTGYKPLLSSTRNSNDAHLHLLNATDCSKLVYTAERKQKALEIKSLCPSLEILQLPSLLEMLENSTLPYPLGKTYQEMEDEPALIIHSSGTTGLPKPVFLTQGYIGTIDKIAYQPAPPGRHFGLPYHLGPEDLLLTTAPFFHLMGFFLILESIFHGVKFAIAPEKPPTAELLTDLINTVKPTAVVLPPSILEDMSHSETALEALGRLKFVFFAGAPLSPDAGNRINQKGRVVSFIGSTEMGVLPTLIPQRKEDWEYMEWNPSYGIDMQPVGEGYHELVVKRAKDRDIHGIFHTYPDLTEYHTKDLFTPHPTRPNLWKYRGRLDDVIVLSNGEKFNPVTMEKVIEGHPLVSRALVVGQARFQSALLIEPNWNLWSEDMPVRDFIEQIWPTVRLANDVGPAHGRIMKDKIGISSKNKPFKTTPKGSTQRRLVNMDYKDEIDTIYANSEQENDYGILDAGDLTRVEEFVQKVVTRIANMSDLSRRTDLYAAGLDSLQTMQIGKALQSAVRFSYPSKDYGAITSQKVYANPTVEQLSRVVYGIVHGEQENAVSRRDKIDGLVQKYTIDLPERKVILPNSPQKHTVILTGSTGSLGSYLLSDLLSDPSVEKIYCLNRSDAKERQAKIFQEKGLKHDSTDLERVEFLKVAFGAERFGIDGTKYEEMLRSVDTIIHNAWRVDFNITVDSFEDPHIKGLRRFVDFSLHSSHHAHIHFVSSVSTIGGWKATFGPAVPEIPLEDCEVALEQGYGESKHVSERICLAAARKAGVPTTIHRVGQIAGPSMAHGQWNKQEWVPTIVATSKSMGKVPNNLGSWGVDWIPVDTLSAILLELVDTRRKTQSDTRCAAFHLINPSVTTWGSLLPAIQKRYKDIQPVEFSDWIRELESIQDPSAEEIAAKPGIKILDFYRALLDGEGALSAPIEVGDTKQASPTMGALGPISAELMGNWLNQWNF
ncbi:hypothetical protein MPDQ_003886 [Monascus purpureus]|uniref:Carrier domain-containing protein n=1 Tax=Monascus purpureus TaxID=5098 RepID=A0A507QM57_MONPU|nr:hypothetical protein MPDQ_003886 [Monascus purpureus]